MHSILIIYKTNVFNPLKDPDKLILYIFFHVVVLHVAGDAFKYFGEKNKIK